jgi:hypothetical protein
MSRSVRKIVVGFSGGVTSAWVAGWALRNYPREDVILLFHDTKAEHPDTYRFLKEMAAALDMPITERSDGRSLDEVFDDHNSMASSRMGFCSKELKVIPGRLFVRELRSVGVTDVTRLFGFSAVEWQRIQRYTMYGEQEGWKVRFPIAEEKITKQQCADWCLSLGVMPSEMYKWSDHANCVGCVKGGKAYWLAVKENAPEVFEHRKQQEAHFGHQMFKGYVSLSDLEQSGLKRAVARRESIDLGPCECGS